MSDLSRRSFLFASSGAAAGTFAAAGLLDAAEESVLTFRTARLLR
jgi:hypothetical protein